MSHNKKETEPLWQSRTEGLGFRTIYPLSLNPAYDISLFIDALGIEQIHIIQREVHNAAGKGVNVARTLTQFGVECCTLLLLGEENQEKYRSLLERESPMKHHILTTPGYTRENYHIFSEGRLYSTLARVGFPFPRQALVQVLDYLHSRVTPDDLVIFGGRFPQGLQGEDFFAVCDAVTGSGAALAVDSNSVTLGQLLQVRPYLIKPNLEELCLLSGQTLETEREIVLLLRQIQSQGIGHILLSMDAQGLYYCGKNGVLRVKVPPVPVQSTVGAGDCTLAGFLCGIQRGDSAEGCARLAAAFGTASVMSQGTVPPTEEDVQRVYSGIKVIPL